MPCTDPKKCWPHGITETGKQRYVFKDPGTGVEPQHVPCSKCVSCQLDRSKEWAVRAVHQAQMSPLNCFITLTYDDEHLPENGSLEPEHVTTFIKKLRKHLSWRIRCYGNSKKQRPILPKGEKREKWYPHNSKGLKYIAAGEYGSIDKTFRPHYHLCIFGWDFPDKKYFFTNKQGNPVYISEILSKLWDYKGHVSIGEFNYKTAAYTARYTLKKVKNYGEKDRYEIIDYKTGETNLSFNIAKLNKIMENKKDEFIRMSQGIGKEWYKKYKSDLNKDYVYVEKQKHKIPRYYDKLREQDELNEEEYCLLETSLKTIKQKRIAKAKELEQLPNKPSHISRDTIKRNKLKLLTRSL